MGNPDYIRPGETCWGVHFNMLHPVRGVALTALAQDLYRSDVRRHPNRTHAFAPFRRGTETPDMDRAVPAYSRPYKPHCSRSAILFRTRQEAVEYWNGRVRTSADNTRKRMQAMIEKIETQYITTETKNVENIEKDGDAT